MIIFKELAWGHAFSYGDNNKIVFIDNPITQLVGKNGHGKSSIALILEEVLYNKNSKNVKKAKILNRYGSSKSYWISLEFSKDGDEYEIHTGRGSTQTVTLFKNGEDVSAHTSTGTYKLIEQVIGYDHKTFTQIIYQSNAFSLEFLTATDTNRKKFLIDLLNLNRYMEIADKIKVDLKTVNNGIELLDMKLNSVNTWLAKLEGTDLTIKSILEVPESASKEMEQIAEITEKLRTLKQSNEKIVRNNKYRDILHSMQPELLSAPTGDILGLKVRQSELNIKISNLNSVIQGTGKILTKCPSCGQNIDNSHKKSLHDEAVAALPEAKALLKLATDELSRAEHNKRAYDASVAKLQEFEKYSALWDKSLPTEVEEEDVLVATRSMLQQTAERRKTQIDKTIAANALASAHNAKVGVLLGQRETMLADKDLLDKDLSVEKAKQSSLQILVKTFSPSGLLAYKIENLIKDLEDIINKYLADMSDGRFQISFKISSSDKLDVIITDNGIDVDINELSNGELARVNTSTLLAIRGLMQSLSNTRANLLILDETIENLDADGKEKLVEVLLKEPHLNTVLVSHSFTHPLIAKVEITKTNNISRIE